MRMHATCAWDGAQDTVPSARRGGMLPPHLHVRCSVSSKGRSTAPGVADLSPGFEERPGHPTHWDYGPDDDDAFYLFLPKQK
jgi:hypothetical protein